MIRVTIAVPPEHIADANQLARVLGYGADDERTFGVPAWQDAAGNLYACCSTLARETFPAAASSPLVEPEWGADMEAAIRAQALIRIGGAASPGEIVAIIGDDPQAALAEMGVVAVETPDAD
jgi:hypothetical protein